LNVLTQILKCLTSLAIVKIAQILNELAHISNIV